MRIRRRAAICSLLVLPLLSSPASAQARQAGRPSKDPGPSLAALDQYVAQAVKDWRVTGLAIAVVANDSLVFAKGYGVLDVGKPERVNEHTRFAIGSTTKAMTSAALAMLVDEGKLKWDDHVIDYLPDFRLYDPWVTRELTIRDLLTHRTGLPSTDLMWARADLSADEMIRRLRFVRPSSSFRSTMEYHNNTYAMGGAIVAKVSGMSWEDFVRTRIFAPLGMNETEPLVATIVGKANVASPHDDIRDTARVVPIRTTDPVASAGSVWSSVSDMSKWMRFVLDSGRVGTKRLIAPATFTELLTPQIRAPMALYPALSLSRPHAFSYALGWFVQDYQGQTVWMHTGSIDGMSALIGLLPDKKVGVYVLANIDHAELRHALMYRVFDMYAGNAPRDWSADLRQLFASARGAAQAGAPTRPAKPTAPTFPLERYAGTYTDSTYGAVDVKLENGALRVRFGREDLGMLTPWDFDAFRAHGPPPEEAEVPVTFVPSGSGAVASVRVFGVTFARAR